MAGAGGFYERRGYFAWPVDRPLEIRCTSCGRLLLIRVQTTGDGQTITTVDPCERCLGTERRL